MSAYYTQWCKEHGEWDMDIDNPSECPKCIELGLTEIQQLRSELTTLKEAFARLREDRDMHSEMRQVNHKEMLRLLGEKLELERQLSIRCGCQFHNNKPIIECGYHQGVKL